MEHSFDIKLAAKYGILEAVLIEYFRSRLIESEIKGEYFQDDRYWVRISITALQKEFSYVSCKTIRNAVEKLVKNAVLYKGNYNQYPYDHTMWYTLNDKFVC